MIGYVFAGQRSEFLPRWSELFNNAIQSLVHVEELKLRIRSKSYCDALCASSFPRLRNFSLTLSVVSDGLLLPSFLNRHPSIVRLMLYRDSCYPRVPSISVRLPNLHCFRGPSSFFTSIVPQAPLSSAYLSWNIGEDFGPAIAVLEGYSKESLVKLSCIRRGCNADLIEYISRHIPDIRSLRIQSPYGGTNPADRVSATKAVMTAALNYDPLQTILDAIGISLSNFTALKHLEYCFSLKTTNKMEDDATVTAWGRACPTLRKIDFCQFLQYAVILPRHS
jgi:hypothetical protein